VRKKRKVKILKDKRRRWGSERIRGPHGAAGDEIAFEIVYT